MTSKAKLRRGRTEPDVRRTSSRSPLYRSGILSLVAAGAMITAITAGAAPASAAARPITTHLANGETVTRYANGATLYTATMHFAKPARGPHPDGYGQNPGNCGLAKLWTYVSNHTYQLSLIGNPGITLGGGSAETSTDGVGESPAFVGINASGRTWTSGRRDIWPGLWPTLAVTVGEDATSNGNCLIVVQAPWN